MFLICNSHYFEIETAESSPVSVGSTLQTESSGVLEGSASVTSTSVCCVGRLLRCLALRAFREIVYKLIMLYMN